MVTPKQNTIKPVVVLLLILLLVLIVAFYKYNQLQSTIPDVRPVYQELDKVKSDLQKEREINKALAAKLKELTHLEKIQKDVVRAWDGGKN